MSQILTASERLSPTWSKIAVYLDARLRTLRQQNDAQMPQEKRDFLVGQIAEVKALLALREDEPIL